MINNTKVHKALLVPLQLSLGTLGCLCASPILAQITSDGTVNTQINTNGNVAEITGGETRGGNLFHSFQDFSVPTDNEAFFNNADSISNILSRVTGGNISNIDGLIRANGSASLFLINPAGIIFGENARLDIGGSFYGSSASSILFEDSEFSAVDNLAQPILTINAPIGLSFRDEPEAITNQSVADDIGLQVDTGKNFTLVGGDIVYDGGVTFAPGGRVELGGLATEGIVNFNDDLSLNFSEDPQRADISLINNSQINVRAGSGGTIAINSQNLEILEGSKVRAGIASGLGSPESLAGNIDVDSTETVTISGANTFISNAVVSGATGNAGDVNITTESFVLRDGGQANSLTQGQGNAGSVNITASNISLDGVANDGDRTGFFSTVASGAVGNGGEINIKTGSLFITNGAGLITATFGEGNAGVVTIEADTLSFDGSSNGFLSGILSNVEEGGEGNGGNIFVETDSLTLLNGGRISANVSALGQGNAGVLEIFATARITIDGQSPEGFPSAITSVVDREFRGDAEGLGNAGSVFVTTSSLSLTNGGRISATSLGQGNGGDLRINATDSIFISGFTERFRSGISVNALVNDGNSGNANIITNQLTIENGGTIAASNFDSLGVFSSGTGEPGNINLEANSISLSNGGRIEAGTQSETGNNANINIQITDDITLRDNSLISAQAFNNADGGNLTIDTRFIIAFPNGNNDILASAQQGQGGNITINAESLFGIQERPLNDETNDINASSEFSLDGNVTINTPDINPVQGATELPTNVVEPEQTTAQVCQTDRLSGISSGLNIEGKGGIPPEPGLPLDSRNIFVNGQTNPQSTIPAPIETAQGKIQPARGVKVTENGEIILTAYRTDNSGDRLPETRKCQ